MKFWVWDIIDFNIIQKKLGCVINECTVNIEYAMECLVDWDFIPLLYLDDISILIMRCFQAAAYS